MFCTAAVKLKDGEEYSDVITIKEEYGKKGKTKEVVYRRCTRTSKEKDLCGLHLRKKDILIFDKSKSIENFIEPSSWSDSSSDESDDEVQSKNVVFCKEKKPSQLEEIKDNVNTEESIIQPEIIVSEDEYEITDSSSDEEDDEVETEFELDESYNYSIDIAIALNKIIDRKQKIILDKKTSFEKISVSIKDVGKTYYYDDEQNACYIKKDGKFILQGILLRVECNKAPIIKNGEFYSITESLIYNKYIFQKCIITNNVYCPNEALQWIKIGVYKNHKII